MQAASKVLIYVTCHKLLTKVRWIEKAEWFHYFTGSSLPLHALHGILFIVLLRAPALLENYNDQDDK